MSGPSEAPSVAPEAHCHHVVQLTDFHLGSTPDFRLRNINTASTLKSVVAILGSHEPFPDRLLLTGDLAEAPSSQTYALIPECLGDLKVPVHFLPGNHDEPELMRETLVAFGYRDEKIIPLGRWRILLLDSTQNGTPVGALEALECEWLDATLTSLKDYWVLVALHHHPVPSGSEWMDTMMVQDGEALMKVLKAHDQVKAVVFGHVHQEMDALQSGIRFLGCPSTCIQFTPESKAFSIDSRPAGYRWLDLYEDGQISTGVVRV